MWKRICFGILLLIFQPTILTSATNVTTPIDRLYEELMKGYKAMLPSVHGEPVNVTFLLNLLQIMELDGQAQVLELSTQYSMVFLGKTVVSGPAPTTAGVSRDSKKYFTYFTRCLNTTGTKMTESWTDVHLVWDPADYDDVRFIALPASEVWLPQIGLINSVGVVRDDKWEQFFPVICRYDGTVFWQVTSLISSACSLDMRSFPFDAQECFVTIGSLAHGQKMVKLIPLEDEINLEFYTTSKQFELKMSSVRSAERESRTMPGYVLSNIEFGLMLMRKPVYYILNLLVPCLVLAMLASLSFMIPVDAGEKLSISITVLLAFSVFLIVLADSTPRTSEQVPTLSIFLAAIMFLTGISLFCTVATLNIHYKDPSRPMSPLFHRLIILKLGKLLKVTNPSAVGPAPLEGSTVALVEGKIESLEESGMELPSGDDSYATKHSTVEKHQVEAIESIAHDVHHMVTSKKEAAKEEEQGKQWQLAAKILDRLFLYIYVVIIFITTISLMIIYPMITM